MTKTINQLKLISLIKANDYFHLLKTIKNRMRTRFHGKPFGHKNINDQTVITPKAFVIGHIVKCHKIFVKIQR